MKKILLVGGPKHGEVLYLKAGVSVFMEVDGKRYEYRQRIFKFEVGVMERSREPYNQAWEVYVHGEPPAAEEILKMLHEKDIPPIFG